MLRSFISISALMFFMFLGKAPRIFAQVHEINIIVDGLDKGRRFDGVGAISAGASSRLLYDYPEPERSQILDYLFKPNYGASLDLLKVEIGSDMNSTDGSEASYMRTLDDHNGNKGYEWWLIKEAKKRNPNIKLVGLAWGAPGWVGGFWSDKTIDYLIGWLNFAKSNGITIDYIGGWNESGYNADWYINFKKVLKKAFPDVQLVAADQAGGNWKVATDMKNNPSFNAAVDVVGVHNPCGGRRNASYQHCSVTRDALSLKKPLWSSEFSSLAHNVGAIPIARALNRSYIDGKITCQMIWSAVSAWYADFPIADTGPILAEWPWSGYYEVGKSVWSLAHTAQFTKPGWYYLNSGSRRLKSGATVVSLASPSESDYSMIIETTDMHVPTTVTFYLRNLPQRKLQIWTTNLESDRQSDYFQYTRSLTPGNDRFQLLLTPGYLYSISTLTDAGKGHARPDASLAEQLAVPFHADFDHDQEGQLARYFSDLSGGFQTEPCKAGRKGKCYEQVVRLAPVPWHGTDMPPTTIMGDPRWWGNYRISTDVLPEDSGYIELLGRVDGVGGDKWVSAYHLRIANSGAWRLYSEDVKGSDTTLATGNTTFKLNLWHTLALQFKDNEIQAFVDKRKIADVQDDRHHTGQVGLRTSKWSRAQFDNVRIVPTMPWPHFLPHDQMKVTATSAHSGNIYGYAHPASAAIDDRPETYWRSEGDTSVSSQSITIDLGAVHNIQGLTYQPKINGNWAEKGGGNAITDYSIYISKNGKKFKKVTGGTWRNSLATTKVVKWKKSHTVRYIRLVATKVGNDGITVGAINVIKASP